MSDPATLRELENDIIRYREHRAVMIRLEAAKRIAEKVLRQSTLSVEDIGLDARRELTITLRSHVYAMCNRPTISHPSTTADGARRDLYAWLRSRAVGAWRRLADRLEHRWPVRMTTYEALAMFTTDELPHDVRSGGVFTWQETGPPPSVSRRGERK